MLVYDITKRSSFESLKKWIDELKNHADDNVVAMVVGNKTDLSS